MKKYSLLLFFILICSTGIAQSRKSVSILGDSYSTYEHYLYPDTNAVWYFQKVRINNSFSGSTICHTGYRKEDYSNRSFITRMNNLGCPDIIFIFGATNDSWAEVPIGEYQYQNWSKKDLYSFRPAMAYMLEYMQNRYPNVEIYFLLNCDLKIEINESVKTICAHYNIPCIELKDIDKQGGHPSIKGMEQINEQLKAFITQQKSMK